MWARIEVEVRDAATGRPVPGAVVAVLDSAGAALPLNVSVATATDASGRATARVLAGMGSASYVVADHVEFATHRESVRVTAPGHAPATVAVPRGGSTWRFFSRRINAVLRVRVVLAPAAPATQPATGVPVPTTGPKAT